MKETVVLISKYIVPNGYVGITFFPFIILKNKNLKRNMVLVNHEKIHLRQQIELLIIPFFIIYVLEFFVRLLYYKNWEKAYNTISFEREAYRNETDLNFLKTRRFWNFINHY